MKSYKLLGSLVVVAVIVALTGIVVAQTGPGGGSGQFDPKTICQQRFDRIDTNQDGTVDKAEFMAAQEELFRMRDGDSSGQLSKEEFCAERPAGMGKGMGPKKQ